MHVAVIAEYNPFHSGHAYQLCEIRRIFGVDTKITVILGGVFSQRGEPYVASPYTRAEAAVRCGADLVLEMPFPFSAAPAKIFARAGVELAEKAGADFLVFGSECGDTEKLALLLSRLDGEEMQSALKRECDAADTLGKTRVYSELFKELYGSDIGAKLPNDILAIEYMRAIKALGAKIKPYAILRKGDYKSGEGEYPSASYLRRLYLGGGIESMKEGMPQEAFDTFLKAENDGLFFPDIERLSSAVLMKLGEKKHTEIAFSKSGIVGRLQNAAKDSKSIAELCEKAATKRYTSAEISRAVLYCLLSVTKEELDAPVLYTKLLALNESGKKLLANVKSEVITKPSATEKLSVDARAQYERAARAERAYALCLKGKYEYLRQSPKIVR